MRVRRVLTVLMAGILLAGQSAALVQAKSSSELQEELDQYEEELSDSQAKSEELTAQIAARQKEVGDLTAQVESLNIEMADYREAMSARIKYFYESSLSGSLLDILFGSENFADFLSRLDYLQSIYSYDAEQLDAYDALLNEVNEKQEQYNEQIEEMAALLEEQEALQDELAESISGTESAYADAREAEEAAEKAAREAAEKEAAEEAAKKEQAEQEANAKTEKEQEEQEKAEQEKAEKEQEEKELAEAAKATVDEARSSSNSSSGKSGSSASDSAGTKSDGSVAVVSKYSKDSGGVLTKSKGVVYYNGHKETWYSTKEGSAGVVTGIPGRYTGSDGIIRDGDGYICVASSDLPKGTLVETSLGMGKVYDTGCASGTIDIYTEW